MHLMIDPILKVLVPPPIEHSIELTDNEFENGVHILKEEFVEALQTHSQDDNKKCVRLSTRLKNT